MDNFGLRFVHSGAVRANDESEEACSVDVVLAFLEQLVLTEAAQNFENAFLALKCTFEVD